MMWPIYIKIIAKKKIFHKVLLICFILLLNFRLFLALYWTKAVFTLSTTMISRPVILYQPLFFLKKLQNRGFWKKAEKYNSKLFCLSFLAFKTYTIFPIWALKTQANFSAIISEICFYHSTILIVVLSIKFWP